MDEDLQRQRERWNACFLNVTWRQSRFNELPNSLLVDAVRDVSPGKALDINMGEGRNALYLAQLGWLVTGVDIADKAMQAAEDRAKQLDVQLTTVECDVNTFDWGSNMYDLIVLSYADEESHVDRVKRALKAGGIVVFENFHHDINEKLADKLDKPIGFDTNAIRDAYSEAGFDILRYEEPIGVADFSKEEHRLVKLVARKQNV